MKIHDAFTRKRNEPFFISISLLITAALACALGSTVLKNSTTPSQQAATSLPLPTRTENLVQVTVTSTASSVIGINALRSSFDLAIDPSSPNIIYVATDGSGVYKSLDGGNIWRPVNTGISDLNVRSLAIDPASPDLYRSNQRRLQKHGRRRPLASDGSRSKASHTDPGFSDRPSDAHQHLRRNRVRRHLQEHGWRRELACSQYRAICKHL